MVDRSVSLSPMAACWFDCCVQHPPILNKFSWGLKSTTIFFFNFFAAICRFIRGTKIISNHSKTGQYCDCFAFLPIQLFFSRRKCNVFTLLIFLLPICMQNKWWQFRRRKDNHRRRQFENRSVLIETKKDERRNTTSMTGSRHNVTSPNAITISDLWSLTLDPSPFVFIYFVINMTWRNFILRIKYLCLTLLSVVLMSNIAMWLGQISQKSECSKFTNQ